MRKTVVGLSLAVLIVVSLFVGVGLVYAGVVPVPNTGIVPTVLKPYVLETPANGWDYFIGQYSNLSYFAVNGSNNDNFLVSTNASYVFNSVSAVAEGIIHVGVGTFVFTNHTDILDNQVWEGEGVATHLVLGDDLPNGDNAFWSNFCFFLAVDGSGVENVTIRNMQFDGNNENNALGSVTHGLANLWLDGARNVLIDNVYSHSSLNNGVDFVAYVRDSYGNVVQNSFVYDNHWNGISFGAGDNDIYDCKAVNNWLWGDIGDIALCVSGTSATETAYRIDFINNIVQNMTGVSGSSGSFWCGIKFEYYSASCRADGNTLNGVRYGVYEAGAAYGNHTIQNNRIYLKDVVGDAPQGVNTAHSHNLIAYNTIYAAPTNDSVAIKLPSDLSDNNYNRVVGNYAVNLGTGYFDGIVGTGGGCTFCVFAFNDLSDASSGIQNGTDCVWFGNLLP